MITAVQGSHVGFVWWSLLDKLLQYGRIVRPRGITCYELPGVALHIDHLRANVLVSPQRGLGYRFMVAEWLWTWFGHTDVATIARYAPHIKRFSDDGAEFYGAYGPRVATQWDPTIRLLMRDPDTRQAVFSIFRAGDGFSGSKDVPCTVSLQLLVRDGYLNLIVNMRSSDAWLGLPYDVFNFSQLANVAAGVLGLKTGWLKMFLGSSHLYETDYRAAVDVVTDPAASCLESPPLPGYPPAWLDDVLRAPEVVTAQPPTDVWMHYANALAADTRMGAFLHLERAVV